MSNFAEVIENYLKERAEQDSLFAEKFNNKNKDIKSCCRFIVSEVKRLAGASRSVACMTDEQVFGLAVHYYDEEDVQVDESVLGNIKIATSVEVKPAEKNEVKLVPVFDVPDKPDVSPAPEPKRAKRKIQEDTAQLSLF